MKISVLRFFGLKLHLDAFLYPDNYPWQKRTNFNRTLRSPVNIYFSKNLSIESPEEHGHSHNKDSVEVDESSLPGSLKQEVCRHLRLLWRTQLGHLQDFLKIFFALKFNRFGRVSTWGASTATPSPSSISTPQSQLRPMRHPGKSFLLAVKSQKCE